MENSKDKERQLKVVDDYVFKDLNHLYKFTEYLSGAKFMVRKHIDYIDEDGDLVNPDEAYEEVVSVRVLYTDGDSGVMEFGFSEIYEEKGYHIELIGCAYCDITPEYMLAIHEVFFYPELYENGEVEVFEKPCLTAEWDSDKPSASIINAKKDRERTIAMQH